VLLGDGRGRRYCFCHADSKSLAALARTVRLVVAVADPESPRRRGVATVEGCPSDAYGYSIQIDASHEKSHESV